MISISLTPYSQRLSFHTYNSSESSVIRDDNDHLPADASRIVTAPSKTLNDRSTSMVKSTCPIKKCPHSFFFCFTPLTYLYTQNIPGVSMRLIRCLFQGIVIAADVIVIPLSRSCSI